MTNKKTWKIGGLLIGLTLFAHRVPAQTFMCGCVECVEVTESQISYTQYDIGFSGMYEKENEMGYEVYSINGLDFIVFRTENWISLYPSDLEKYALLLGASIGEQGIVVEHEDLGRVFFGEYIFGEREYNFNTPPPEFSHISFSKIESTSFLTETVSGTRVEYPPENLLDWDLRSCWVEGSEGSGEGEILNLKLNGNAKTGRLIFYSGYFDPQNLSLFEKNARPKTLEITTDSGATITVELLDSPRTQFIELPEYTNSIEILILDVYQGSEYQDCAISGIFADLTAYQFNMGGRR